MFLVSKSFSKKFHVKAGTWKKKKTFDIFELFHYLRRITPPLFPCSLPPDSQPSCLPERRPSERFLWCSLSATTILYSLPNKSQLHILSFTMKVEMTIYLWLKNRNCSGWGWRLADGIHEIGLKCLLMSFQVLLDFDGLFHIIRYHVEILFWGH